MSAEEDHDLLVDRRCTDIKTISCGGASLVHGYQRDEKKRMYCLRYNDKVARFHLPARASSHARREALWTRRAAIVQACPDADVDLLALVRDAVSGMKVS